jgi:hypothetical protein
MKKASFVFLFFLQNMFGFFRKKKIKIKKISREMVFHFFQKMASWENFLEWQQKKHFWDNDYQDRTKIYFTKELPLFLIDPFAYLVKYRKSQMRNWPGPENEDYYIPDDLVNDYFKCMYKLSRSKGNYSDYHDSIHVDRFIRETAIKELKAERPAPICDIKFIDELTESQLLSTKELFLLLFNQEIRKPNLFVSCLSEDIFAIAIIDFNDTKITYFGVNPKFRKLGYGETLLKFLKSKFFGISVECTTQQGIDYFEKYAISKTVRFLL